MSLIVEAIEDDRTEVGMDISSQRPRIDVTEMNASEVQRYVESNVATDSVSFEHRGARTFLILGE